MIKDHAVETGSAWAHELVDNFSDYASRFWLVKPKAASLSSLQRRLTPIRNNANSNRD